MKLNYLLFLIMFIYIGPMESPTIIEISDEAESDYILYYLDINRYTHAIYFNPDYCCGL